MLEQLEGSALSARAQTNDNYYEHQTRKLSLRMWERPGQITRVRTSALFPSLLVRTGCAIDTPAPNCVAPPG